MWPLRINVARVATIASLLIAGCAGTNGTGDALTSTDVVVIDVTGLPYVDARAELRELGLDVRRAEAASPDDRGLVIEQSVSPGRRVTRNTAVTLTVSRGAPPAPTPVASEHGSWARTYSRVSDGVVRIETTTCEGVVTGSGFLVDADLVATNAHVVDDGLSVTVDTGDAPQAAQVIGVDATLDLALVEVDEPLAGHVFESAGVSPDVGADVAAIGYPLGEPLSLATGTISGLGRQVGTIAGAIQTDTAVNPGNSGGPLVDLDGDVVGVIVAAGQYQSYEQDRVVVRDAEGLAYAIPSAAAFPMIDGWSSEPTTITPATCGGAAGGSHDGPRDRAWPVTATVDHPQLAGVIDTFEAYVTGINTGDYRTAYERWSRRLQQRMTYDEFTVEQSTSFLYDVVITAVEQTGAGQLAVDVGFRSEQAPEFGPEGQACSVWSLTYRMMHDEGRWLIDRAEPRAPGSPVPCQA